VTVHKSQGQTLNVIGVIAEKDAFAHGQVYVALSRVGSWDNIHFYSPRQELFIKNNVAKNLIDIVRHY
jgi:ATP-dependent exoDNAse (exonuclease V) alpha subunit